MHAGFSGVSGGLTWVEIICDKFMKSYTPMYTDTGSLFGTKLDRIPIEGSNFLFDELLGYSECDAIVFDRYWNTQQDTRKNTLFTDILINCLRVRSSCPHIMTISFSYTLTFRLGRNYCLLTICRVILGRSGLGLISNYTRSTRIFWQLMLWTGNKSLIGLRKI